ncbi:MAG: ATP-binding protein [Actinomycetota bacterium]
MATSDRSSWVNTTHDWAAEVDHNHLETVRRAAAGYAPSGVLHLVLEVLAYAEDEAEALGRTGACLVVLHADGSLSVSDDGRGTDTRRDATGDIIRKPVMSTADLRFFDSSDVDLPDGHPRRGISVVAALSRWLVHTNRRAEGSWTQRYELGVPTTGLVPVWSSGTTGTLVHFLPDRLLLPRPADADELRDLATRFSWLDVGVATE